MENTLFFLSRYQKINESINHSIENTIWTIALCIGFIASFAAVFFGTALMAERVEQIFPSGIPGGNFSLLILLIINIALWGAGTSYAIYWLCLGTLYPLRYIFTSIYRYITDLHYQIESNISGIQDITDILDKIDIIKYLYSFLRVYKSVIYCISHSHYAEFVEVMEDTLRWILSILTDLRSDLSTRLVEQQSALESSKLEVEKNITGTTELDQISKLQGARLDRQIEQFEELQRVLVMV